MAFVGVLAERHDVADRGLEFLFGELHLTGEGVEVANECGHDLAQARIGRPLEFLQHRLGDIFLVIDNHA